MVVVMVTTALLITETQGFTIFGSRGVGKNLKSHPF